MQLKGKWNCRKQLLTHLNLGTLGMYLRVRLPFRCVTLFGSDGRDRAETGNWCLCCAKT